MAKKPTQWGTWYTEGLRTRFRPRGRISNTFLQVVPWINFVVVLALFFAISRRLTLQPGVVFDLPRAPFHEGIQQGLSVVMLRPQRGTVESTLVFFDDVRYQLEVPEQGEQLRTDLAQAAQRPAGRQLLLLADRRVPHGDVMALVDLARDAGIQRVNVATKPD